MTEVFVYQFIDYKAYLNAYIEAQPKRGYGFKSRIAEAVNCKTAYVAQVLNGHAHFSPEQAEGLNGLIGHSADEADFFLFLVQLARAGTEPLRRRLRAQIKSLRDKQLNLKQRFQERSELGEAEMLEYFSRWSIAAVHTAATVPELRTRKAIAQALRIDDVLLKEAMDFLLAQGLLKEQGGQIDPGPSRLLFVGKDSPILKMHHSNWRTKATQALDASDPNNLHFSGVYSLSASDAEKIREKLIREIEVIRKTVQASPEEELHAFTLDFFRVDRR